MRQIGISPKLLAAVATAIVTYLLGQTVLDLPAVAVVIGQAALIALAAYTAGPGLVVPADPGTPSDDVLLADRATRKRLAGDGGQYDPPGPGGSGQ